MSSDPPVLPPYEAFDELSRLIVSEHALDSVMTAIAEVGKKLLPSVSEVSVTLVRSGKAETIASTGPLAVQMDERQYSDETGPCLTAAREGQLISLPDAGAAQRYPLFAAAARERGVGSSLSVPVKLPEPVSAGLNMYSDQQAGFPQHDIELAQTLAAYAAMALFNVYLYDSQQRVAEHLEKALGSRGVIDQAKGILMAEHRCTPDAAFERLVDLSQHTNRKLRDVAQQIVDSTSA